MITCAISGELCENPVMSPQGNVFEKKLIETQLNLEEKCPLTGTELKINQLVPIKNYSKPQLPRPSSATSLASLLKQFQNEWDAIMLEMFTLRKEHESTRQELSNSLYQYDAACRVIARLIKERDEARAALADTQKNMAVVLKEAENSKTEKTPLELIIEKSVDFAKRLTRQRRRKQKIAHDKLISVEKMEQFKTKKKILLKNFESKGISTICLLSNAKSNIQLAISSLSGEINIIKFDLTETPQNVIQKITKHKKCVSKIISVEESSLITASHDNSIIFWKKKTKKSLLEPFNTFTHHADKIVGIALQAIQKQFISASADRTWAFCDLARGAVLFRSPEQSSEFKSIAFHPDGLIFGTGGADNALRIWDLKTKDNVATFEGHKGSITSTAFSENGYYLASGDNKGVVKTWDLRKSECLKTIDFNAEIKEVGFDLSGGYLSCSGDFGLSVYAAKTWDLVSKFTEECVSSTVFGENSNFVICGLKERNEVKVYSFDE